MKIEGYIGAELSIASLPDLWLQASYTDQKWIFSGESREGQELSLREIQESLLPQLPPLPVKADLKVSDVRVEFTINQAGKEKAYSLDLSGKMNAEWEYDFGKKAQLSLEKLQLKLHENKNLEFGIEVKPFSMADLGVTLEFIKDVEIKRTSFNIRHADGHFHTFLQGGIRIKEFEFLVSFIKSHDKETNKNWIEFFGEIRNTYSLAGLGFFTGELKKVLPENIRDLTVKKLLVRYNSLNEEFVFEAGIKDVIHFDVNIGKLERIAVNECSFLFQVTKLGTEVKIRGDLSINKTRFVVNTKLSTLSGLSLEIRNEDKVEINFKDITDFVAGDIGVWDLVPPFFQRLELKTIELLFQTSPLLASLNIVSTHWGSIYGGIGKLNGTANGVLVCITPPGHIPFSQLHAELALLETLDLAGSYLILSSFPSGSIKDGYLPERLKEMEFIDGLTLCAALSLNPERIKDEELKKKMLYFKEHIIDIQQLSIKATLGTDPSKIAIEGYVGKISLGGGVLELSKAGIGVSANLDLTLFGTISLDLGQFIQLEKMSFSMYLKVQANGVTGYGIWEGNLGTREVKRLGEAMAKLESSASALLDSYDQSQNFIKGNELFNSAPFQQIQLLPDLQIRKVGLVLGISFQGIPSFGCIGEFTLNGDKDEHWGMIAFLFDSANPSKCLFDLKFPKDTLKTLEDVILNFQKFILEALGVDKSIIEEQLHDNKIFRLLDFDGFYEDKKKTKWVPLRAKVAVTDVKIGNVFYDMGILLQGKIGFLNNYLAAIFNLKITKTGIYGFGKLKKFIVTLNNTSLLELGESKQSVVSKDVVLKQNLDIGEAEFQGPYIILNAPFTDILEARLQGSAHINFLGSQLDTFYLISTKGLCFGLLVNTALGELSFSVVVESLTSFEALSEFDVEFNFDIFSIKAKGSAGVYLKDNKLKAHLNFKAAYYHPLEKKYIFLQDIDLEFEAPPELVKIFTDVLVTIKDEVIRVAGAVFEEIKKVLARLAEEIKAIAAEVYEIAKQIDEHLHISEGIQRAIEEGREAIRLIGNGIEEVKRNLARLGEEIQAVRTEVERIAREIAEKINQLAHELERAANEVGAIIRRVVGDFDKLTLPILINAKNALQWEWQNAENDRLWHYSHRRQLEGEINFWNAIPHGARIAYHFNLEGVNEARKLALSGPIQIVESFIGLSQAIQNEINLLESQKQNAIATENQKENIRGIMASDAEAQHMKIRSLEEEVAWKEKKSQEEEVLRLKAIENKKIKEEELARKREELKEITPSS